MAIQALRAVKAAESGLITAAKRNGAALKNLNVAESGHKGNKLAIDEFSGWCEDRPDYGWMDCYEAHQRCEERKQKWKNFWKALGDLFD